MTLAVERLVVGQGDLSPARRGDAGRDPAFDQSGAVRVLIQAAGWIGGRQSITSPYSLDLRERVVASVVGGRTSRATAALFGVSVASVVKWWQRHRQTGSSAAKPMGGSRRAVLHGERDWLLARIAAAPDLTLRAVQAERGVAASYGAVWSFVAAEGYSFKKNLRAAEQERADVARKRARWRHHQGRIDPALVVFVDETWAKTNMTRSHGRAARGQRLVARVPHGRWTTMTFLEALRCDRIEAPCVLDGPIDARRFLAWVVQFLIPTLRPGDVVVADNINSHRGRRVRRAIRGAGCHLLFLPPYSPDLNPIEQVLPSLRRC